jgi:hypothetical protein
MRIGSLAWCPRPISRSTQRTPPWARWSLRSPSRPNGRGSRSPRRRSPSSSSCPTPRARPLAAGSILRDGRWPDEQVERFPRAAARLARRPDRTAHLQPEGPRLRILALAAEDDEGAAFDGYWLVGGRWFAFLLGGSEHCLGWQAGQAACSDRTRRSWLVPRPEPDLDRAGTRQDRLPRNRGRRRNQGLWLQPVRVGRGGGASGAGVSLLEPMVRSSDHPTRRRASHQS